MPFLALQGTRVIEATTGVAGPFCARLLADYGAEIIKVERPGAGDPSRAVGPFPDGAPHIEKSGLFLHLNANKKSVTLDLEDPSGRERFRQLVERSHVLIESHPPGKLESLGLGYDALRQIRPDLVMSSITPFGQTGPHRQHAFTELTIFAAGGAMHREGMPDREPLKYGGEIAQYFAATVAAGVTTAACLRSRIGGMGEWIDISIQECMAGHPHQAGRRAFFAYAGELDSRRGPHAGYVGGREAHAIGTFECKDGFVSFLPLGPRMWPGFATMIGRRDLMEDTRFRTPLGRQEHQRELEAIFQSWLDRHTREQVFTAGQEVGLPCGPVLSVDEVMADAHFKARDYFVDVRHPEAGTLTYPGLPFTLSDVARVAARPAPRLGQHNEEVLGRAPGAETSEDLDRRPWRGTARARPRATSANPLEGVRVLELAEIWAGPFCGTLLSDLGAEVTAVESIQRTYRGEIRPGPGSAGYAEGEPGDRPWNRWANFNSINRSKMGITLNLTSARGADTFRELVGVSDVVLCNYAFGVMDSFGLGYDELRRIRPDLVMVLMPGFGNTGPYKRYRSMGMTIDAITGHSALRGYPDLDLSWLTMVHHPDAVGGVTAMFAICAALTYRANTGRGQFIDMSQAEAFMPHLGEVFLEYGMTGRVRAPRGNEHPDMSPHGCYPCDGDDRWVTIAVRSREEWLAFCQAAEMPSLARDSRFATIEARLRNREELDRLVGRWTSSRDRYDVTGLLQERGIPAAPVLDCGEDTYDDPHLQKRGYFQEVTHRDAGTFLLSGPLWKLDGATERTQRPAPCLGQHNGYVLGQVLGFPRPKIEALERELVIGTAPLEGADMGGVRRVKRGM